MEGTLTRPEVWEHWRDAQRLALLAAFEDSATGTWVKDFRQRLSGHLCPQCRLVEHIWLFSTFRLPELQEIAAEEASSSDLVIISAHQAHSLPEEVRVWIELWLRHKGNHATILLALLDEVREDDPDPVQAYLQRVAHRGNMAFLVESM
jgi:hypothetical protein